jgi:hypothetical protein
MTRSRFLACLASGLLALALGSSSRADPPLHQPPQEALDRLRDLALTLRARRTLQEDNTLASYNLGVWVENGVAKLWGGVPNSEVGRQAVARLKGVAGIREVHSQLHTMPLPEVPLAIGHSVGYGPRSVPPPPPVVPTAAPTAPVSPRPTPALRPARELQSQPPQPTLVERARAIVLSDSRFHSIPVSLQDGVLFVRRGIASDEDTAELAQRLRQLSGVADVVLTSD